MNKGMSILLAMDYKKVKPFYAVWTGYCDGKIMVLGSKYRITAEAVRPFSDVNQMNEHLVQKWNEVVGPDDEVYVLGDIAMNKLWVTVYVPRLNGIKHLISGNHDNCHPLHYKQNEEKRQRMFKLYYNAGFTSIQTEMTIRIADQKVKLHHMPYKSDHTKDERYSELRPKDDGGWLLHGHVHDLWKIKDKQINVGVDVWNFTPVPITVIEQIIINTEKV